MENRRIMSTVTLIIFLAFLCFLCWLAIELAVMSTDALNSNEPVSTGDGTKDLIINGTIALTFGTCFIMAMACAGFAIITAMICFGFSVRNARVPHKPVKIINIILCCLFAACAVAGATALILMRVL